MSQDTDFADWAAVDFEPIPEFMDIGDDRDAYAEWKAHLVVGRLAMVALSRTKPELTEQLRQIKDEGMMEDWLENFELTAKHLQAVAELCKTARIRSMVALSVVAIEEGARGQ